MLATEVQHDHEEAFARVTTSDALVAPLVSDELELLPGNLPPGPVAVGGTIGVAATGAIFQSKLGAFDPATLTSGGAAEASKFTDALGAAMALGAVLTAVGAVVATLVISGKPKHELSAHGGPELPRSAAILPSRRGGVIATIFAVGESPDETVYGRAAYPGAVA